MPGKGTSTRRRRRNGREKIDANPLLPFTYDDAECIIPLYKKKPLELFAPTPEAECDRRVDASNTLMFHSSVPALDRERGCFVDLRELKGLEIAARSRIAFDGGVWIVPSQTSSGKYRVTLKPGADACTCDDFALTAKPCKHIHAARIVRERDGGEKSPEVDTNIIPKKPTYKRDWPQYEVGQSTEKNRFQVLLSDLCRGIVEPPPPKCGRRPHLMRDMVFGMVFKVYSTFSSRRFSCDLKDAHAKGYLSKPFPGREVCAFFGNPKLTPILQDLIVQSSLPLRVVESTFAPDSTGFSTSRFVRWFDEKYGVTRSGKAWVKAHAICGVKTNVITSVEIHDKDAADCPQFKPLVEKTAENFTVKEVCADKAYLSKENLELVDKLGGTAYIPFKVNSGLNDHNLWDKMFHYYSFHRDEFLQHYHQRSNAESSFSMIKAKFRDHVRSKTDVAMKNEVLCKFLAHNLCVVHQSHIELGIEPVFWQDEPAEEPVVLQMVRPG
jgi:transposase